ncbi:MAG: hypothetical protein AAGE52_34240 [Myxococcota bacterium]
MKKIVFVAAALAAGCSSAPTAPTPSTTAGSETSIALSAAEPGHADIREAPEASLPRFDADVLAELPSAPWSQGTVEIGTAPAVVMAWASAENRGWCAPLAAPTGESVSARASDLDGGWVVEFDEAGQPGVDENGEACADCGRGVFGIAGTSMGVDEMLDEPTPSYADGSASEVVEDGVAAATIAIQGQGCVYQVWSFRGRDHLNALVDELRFVNVSDLGADAIAEIGLPYE